MSHRQTFAQWWAEIEPELIKSARRYGTSQDDAEDAVQDIALLAVENYKRFPERTELRKWLLARLHWRTLDNLRRGKVYAAIDLEEIEAPAEGTQSDELVVGEMMALIGELPPRQREVIMMTIQGYTSAVIAQKMGISERTVRSLKRFGRNRLARLRANKEF